MTIFEVLFMYFNLTVAIIALIYSIITGNKSRTISKENTRLSHAAIELDVRNMISESKRIVSDICGKLSLIQLKIDNSSEPVNVYDEHLRDILTDQYNNAKQELLNSYEEACSKYLDDKIDKIRFK